MSKAHINTFLRTDETWSAYQKEPKRHDDACFLCNMDTIESFKYWYICENQYPYDAVAMRHHMLVPIDHVSHETELPQPVRRELELILNRLNSDEKYDCIIRNFAIGQSQPQHLHYHLITWKRR